MKLSPEIYILICINAICIIAFFLVPGRFRREAQAILLFHQLITWLSGIIVVQLGLIVYPVREFEIASHTSFTFEFIAFPVIAVYFNLLYPTGRSPLLQWVYYVCWTGAIILPEVWFEAHTRLILYTNWTWYWSGITLASTMWITRVYYKWMYLLSGRPGRRTALVQDEAGTGAGRRSIRGVKD